MNKLIEFIKCMRIASKILFVIWFFCGVLGSLGEKGLFIPFTAILFVPIVIVELCKNPILHNGNSSFFAFMKNSKIASRILIFFWTFCLLMFMSQGLEDFSVFPVMTIIFFLPAFLIEYNCNPVLKRNQNKVNNVDIKTSNATSQKSWIATFLLCLFTGHLGGHRFYAGKIGTGVVWLCTMGCFGIGTIVDLITIAIGRFTDKDGGLIKNNSNSGVNNYAGVQQTSRINSTSLTKTPAEIKAELSQKKEKWVNGGKEKLQQWRESNGFPKQNPEGQGLQFSDVVVSGTEEKKQSIPKQVEGRAERNRPYSSGITLTIRTDVSRNSNDEFYFDLDDDYSSKFEKDIAKYIDKEGKEVPHVPFMQYWATYDGMDRAQKEWYFYWRSQVRKNNYLSTDLSYIFVHIYELLNDYGWKRPQDGYDQLVKLWVAYRTQHPQLDRYLMEWLFDFARVHNLEFVLPEIEDLSFPNRTMIKDILIEKHSNEKPLKLPFALVDALCDYSLVGSKFYKDGHQVLMHEAIPRVLALADAALIKKSGKGILETYGPTKATNQMYYAFPGANCKYAHKRMDVMLKSYSNSYKLRKYINELVRFAENVLRELYECRGRLRGVELDAETANLVTAFLKKEYAPNKKPIAPEKKAEVKLNFENIAELRNQSDAVRDALEVIEDIVGTKELLTDLEAVKEIFTSMPAYCRTLIDSMQSNSWEIAYDSSVQATIEKINELSGMKLACAILVVEGNTLILEDDYRDEFNYIYEHLSEFNTPESTSTEDDSSKFVLDGLSDEIRQLLETLSSTQKEILYIILSQENIRGRIEEIANAEMSMPEILVDEINDIATQYIGDILIDTFGDEMCVLEQYADELKKAMK